MIRRLDNDGWGFDSKCFVCEASNPSGLGISFFYDPDLEEVLASFELDDRFSGAPSWVHGGIVTAILDDAMVWATITTASLFAATKEATTRFLRPVRIGRSYEVRGKVLEIRDDELTCESTITDDKGRPCATTRATFTPLGAAKAADALGTEATETEAPYLRS